MSSDDLLVKGVELSVFPKSDASSDGLIQSSSSCDKVTHAQAQTQTQTQTQNNELEPNSPLIRNGYTKRNLFQGWKFTIFLALTSSVVVLLFNVAFLIFTASQQGKDPALSRGNCERVNYLSTGFHWIINALSTVLLAASNFAMQCLVAPTRKEIDQAHAKRRWLDAGVPSIRNLFSISPQRSILWFCLLLSSLPLHLFYNSAIFYEIAVPAYDVFVGPEIRNVTNWADIDLGDNNASSTMAHSLRGLFDAGKRGNLEQLSPSYCVVMFGDTYQTSYGKVLLVVNDNSTYGLLYTNPVYQPAGYSGTDDAIAPYEWLCPADVNQETCIKQGTGPVQSKADNHEWIVNSRLRDGLFDYSTSGSTVQYCLAEPAPENCSLQYSIPLTIATIVCNIIKTCVLLYIWLKMKDTPILTIGDAIASFLRCPDPHSKDLCLAPNGKGAYIPIIHATPRALYDSEERRPVKYTGKRLRRGAAVSSRWGFFIFFWVVAFIISILLLAIGARGLANGVDGQFGAISSQNIVNAQDSGSNFITNSFIANLPQVIFSFLYVAYNSLLTSMCLAAEWSRFATGRKGLRVSHGPMLAQRSNYFLSIPYRFAIPLITVSAILHWLVSQSLFVIAVEAYDSKMQRDPSQDVYACGYSSVAITSALGVAVVMFSCLIVISLRRLKSAMPVTGSCSIAIAAACHPGYDPNLNVQMETVKDANSVISLSPREEEEMAVMTVQWGSTLVSGPVGHCSFTSGDVYPPEEGKEYQ